MTPRSAPDVPPTPEPRTQAAVGGNDVSNIAERQFEAVRTALSERRRELGISMSELARQIGVSPSMISQIERGHTLPSVATLFALAAALGAQVDAFFTDPDDARSTGGRREARTADAETVSPMPQVEHEVRQEMYVVRQGHRAGIDIRGGVRWERLTPASLDEIEFLELIYSPGAESSSELYRHPGLESVLILEGRFDIHVGFERYELHPGDSILFPSSIPHRYVNPSDTISRAVTVIIRDPLVATEPLTLESLAQLPTYGGMTDGEASQRPGET